MVQALWVGVGIGVAPNIALTVMDQYSLSEVNSPSFSLQ